MESEVIETQINDFVEAYEEIENSATTVSESVENTEVQESEVQENVSNTVESDIEGSTSTEVIELESVENTSISVENEEQTENNGLSDSDQEQSNESVSIVTETVVEYMSTYTEEQHAEILQRLDNIHTAIQYGDCLLIVFILVMLCSYSYRFINMFFSGRKGSW